MAHQLVDDPPPRAKYRGATAPLLSPQSSYAPPPYNPYATPSRSKTRYTWAFCDWFLILLLIGFLIWFLVLVTVNYNDHGHYIYVSDKNEQAQPTFLDHGIKTDPLTCKVAEAWDPKLRMCAPVIHWPIAVNNDMMDNSVTACDDFYQHACGKWIQQHENENYAFSYVHAQNQKQLHDIVLDTESGPVHTFYQSCVAALVDKKEHALEETQLERRHLLEKIVGNVRHYSDLPVAFGKLVRAGFTSPFTISIEQHPRLPIMVPLFQADGFEKDEVDETSIAQVFEEAHGMLPVHAGAFAKRVMRVVQGLEEHKTNELNEEIHSYVKYVQSEQFKKDMIVFEQMPAWPDYANHADGWNTYLQRVDGHGLRFDPKHPTWLLDGDYIRWLFQTGLHSFTMDEWRAYLTYCVLHNTHQYAPQLPQDVYFRKHEYLSHVSPEKQHVHRLKKRTTEMGHNACVKITQYMLPGLVARAFLKKHFPQQEETRTKLTQLVNRMVETFAQMIEQTHWMDRETKTVTAEKVRAIIPRVVHPNTWSNEHDGGEPFASRLSRDRWLYNMDMVRAYRVERNMASWHEQGKYNRDTVALFSAPLSTVNAFYSPMSNTITIFAGILRPPFYHYNYSDLSIMARMGTILGHELSHSVDNHGRQFTKDGLLPEQPWWTVDSIRGFEQQAQCIVNEYGPPQGCNNAKYGEQTLGEDIADLSGLTMSYLTHFQNQQYNQTQAQWFFQSFAQMWAANFDQEYKCKLVNEDEHALPSYRVTKTLRQMKAFQQAYGCGNDSNMVKEEGKQCIMYGKQ